MGAQQSSSREGSANNGGVMKTCYYELLGVERQASDDEIKKAYRKKALELHPDRNYGDVERATEKFAEIQSAYEVLSDPQERVWYDSHRISILGGGTTAHEHFEGDVGMTSASQIINLMGKFDNSVEFTDAPNGFFGILQDTFASLAKEEAAACDWSGLDIVDYPEFGSAKDNYEDGVRQFYRVWVNFSTKKSFSWRDLHHGAGAPDRAIRRLMEKENRKAREEGKAEFNDAVRHLAIFARKRDPRYTPNSQTLEERQKILRNAASAQAARSRAAHQAKLNNHVVPDWAKSEETQENIIEDSSEESEFEEIECVICRKTFKSENQYEAHTKSKKHIKAVQQIQKQMRKENKTFELDLDTPSEQGPTTATEEVGKLDGEEQQALHEEEVFVSDGDRGAEVEEQPNHLSQQDGSINEKSEGSIKGFNGGNMNDEDYVPRAAVENRLAGSISEQEATTESEELAADKVPSKGSQKRIGKAKAKRAKKAAQQEALEQQGQDFKCATCHESFASKSKLFSHIKELDHAQLVAKVGNGKKKRK